MAADEPISIRPSTTDFIYLIILSILCTTFAYLLALRSLRHLSAFASTLTVNLEPVYGILLAWAILKEHKELSGNFYGGVGIIVLAVIIYPYLQRRKQSRA
jgi:drug/metabolite transporter (DMT)-like permease